jgi:tetratricopeptide (TPR) repeat protein
MSRREGSTRSFAVVSGLAALCAATSAEAQSAAEQAAAEALFREARQLMGDGRLSAACAKFTESQRLDPKLGTLLNLASCHEQEGKTASAWAEFTQAIGMAEKAKQEARAEFARTHVAALESRLSRVMFVISGDGVEAPPGMTIHVGDRELAAAALGSRIPLDPGKYDVEVTAPGKRRWSTAIELPPGPATLGVAIPPLADIAPAQPASQPEVAPPPDGGGGIQRPLALVLGGLGLVGIGLGTYFGIRTLSKQGVVDDNCQGELCNQEGLDADEDAHTSATVSTIAFAAGGALAIAGLVVVLTASSSDDPAPQALWLSPRVSSQGLDLKLGGAW